MWNLLKQYASKFCFNRDGKISAEELYEDVDQLDYLSNRVNDLLSERRYEEARSICQQLLNDYPGQVDGLHRFAETYAAMGRYEEAAEYYRRAAKFMREQEYFEQEAVDVFLAEAAKLEKRSK